MELSHLIQEMFAQCKELKLLYVEDDPTISQTTEEMLKPFFKSVTMASNGAQGLEAFRKEAFDIVLTDVMMPVLDGNKMSRTMREMKPTQVIMVMSALEDIEHFREFIEIGISKFIPKPFVIKHLLSSFISTATDINNAKKVFLMAEDTKNSMNEAQRIAKLGSWYLNLKTNELHWSDQIYALFEIDPAAHKPSYEGFLEAVHPDDRELVNSTYLDSVKHKTQYNYIHRLLMPDGRIKYVHEQGETLYSPDGEAVSSRGTVHDVTEQKELENTLILAKETAQKANQVKSDFLANMSHEIRTPLNGVLGLTDLVLQTQLEPLQRDYLLKSQTAATALLGILNNILDYSKIEANRLNLNSKNFNLKTLLNTLHDMFDYQAEQKKLVFEHCIDESVPEELIGDPLRLQQVLSNLVANALKFTDSGYVKISITATKQNEHDTLVFSISDSGIGMTDEDQAVLFQPFSQVDSSFTRKFGGSGLGLVITKELVELMGGNISVQSAIGQGSTFTFSAVFNQPVLNHAKSIEKTTPNSQNDLFLGRSIHLLLVEDNDLNQLVATERLKQMGITCDIANNGLEAVDMVQKTHYDAILMDIQMPVMDGLEATRQIRRLEGKENIPIIALSAAALKKDQDMAIEAGVDDFISKPIDNALLRSTLMKHLSV
jgi:two-component system sensor histidine kinase/response regulator